MSGLPQALGDVLPMISDDGDVLVEHSRRVDNDDVGERRRIIGCFRCCESKYPKVEQSREVANIHSILLLAST